MACHPASIHSASSAAAEQPRPRFTGLYCVKVAAFGCLCWHDTFGVLSDSLLRAHTGCQLRQVGAVPRVCFDCSVPLSSTAFYPWLDSQPWVLWTSCSTGYNRHWTLGAVWTRIPTETQVKRLRSQMLSVDAGGVELARVLHASCVLRCVHVHAWVTVAYLLCVVCVATAFEVAIEILATVKVCMWTGLRTGGGGAPHTCELLCLRA